MTGIKGMTKATKCVCTHCKTNHGNSAEHRHDGKCKKCNCSGYTPNLELLIKG